MAKKLYGPVQFFVIIVTATSATTVNFFFSKTHIWLQVMLFGQNVNLLFISIQKEKNYSSPRQKFRFCNVESTTLTKCSCKMSYYGNIVIKSHIWPTRSNVVSVNVGQTVTIHPYTYHEHLSHEMPDRNWSFASLKSWNNFL